MDKAEHFESIRHLIPKKLGDVVKKNRNIFKLEHVTPEDLSSLSAALPITNLKGIVRTGFLYKCVAEDPIPLSGIFLIGHRVGSDQYSAVNTSRVIAYDASTNVVLTKSGSHYVINELITGEPGEHILLHICNHFNIGFLGKFFGIPLFQFRVRRKAN